MSKLCSFSMFVLVLLVALSLPKCLMGQRGVAPRDLWCVAKNNAADQALQEAINWACGQGGANCGPIQQGGACYDSNDMQRTASWAFNDYYLKNGLTDDACYFSNTAALTSLNPSNWILYIFELNIILGSFLFLVSGSVRFEVWLVVVGVSCIFVIALLILD
ncbi:hypothetical protein POPTR_013G119500v4 [Populus trichocarpa]|uniref:Uncharacterized protein n=2 Tax=Populus trichocarpa TaxID=3694 RepID=A0ACC0S374_POPTR|nr:unknown [Populus trichocarpa]KAI5567697.1 hypothetical protein BDE02_13G108600 [Populus trichocarpa]KAI9383714.1 hypothetical protein POPTR_013G119500v4 [Populus trichocarpa]